MFNSRKQSTSSSLSSTSTLPDSPRINSACSIKSPNISSRRKTSTTARRQSNLADIQSDQESQYSTTVLAESKAMNNRDARRDKGSTGKAVARQKQGNQNKAKK